MKVDFSLTGPITIDCDNEDYTIASDGTISLTNINTSGDCLHDALASNDVTLKGIKYSSDSDTITASVKYSFFTETLTLSKVSTTQKKFLDPTLTTLSGEYSGTKTILGQTITVTVTVLEDMKVDFSLTGPITIDCENEDYTIASDGTISLTNINTSGDCLHDALASNDVTLKGIKYSSDSDTITASVKYSFFTETLTLSKVSTTQKKVLDLTLTTLSGEYSGTKTILGQTITVTVTVLEDMKVDFSLTGPITIDCENEDYTIASDGTISLTNINTSGDCLHDALASSDVTLKGIKYSSDSDSITASVKYSFFTETLTLSKVSATQKVYLPLVTTAPDGEYSGTKKILGETITASVTFGDDLTLNFDLTGPLTIDCTNEAYTIASDGTISVTDINTAGDCLHDALASNDVTLKGIKYATDSDTITVSVKYSFLTESITLTKVTAYAEVPTSVITTAPYGQYQGSKTILGQTITADVTFGDDMTLSFDITGPLTIDCTNEAYTIASDGTISMTNINTAGDCLHDAMASNDVTLKGIKYAADSDTITVSVKYSFFTESLTLSKVTVEVAEVSTLELFTALSGEYSGSKTIFGVTFTTTITFGDEAADFSLTGPLTINCANEAYTMASDGTISMTGINKSGDCLHDAMASNDVEMKGMKYSADSDSVAVSFKYSFLTESITLTKVTALIAPTTPNSNVKVALAGDADERIEIKAVLLEQDVNSGKAPLRTVKILSNKEYREEYRENKQLLG